MIRPATVLDVLWSLLGLYWLGSSLGTKKIAVDESKGLRLFRLAILGLMLALLLTDWLRIGLLAWRFVPQSPAVIWLGVVLTGVGAVLAIWARRSLGANWSDKVVLKVDHELIGSSSAPLFAPSDLHRRSAGRRRLGASIGEWRGIAATTFPGYKLLREGHTRRKNSGGAVWRGVCGTQAADGIFLAGPIESRTILPSKMKGIGPSTVSALFESTLGLAAFA